MTLKQTLSLIARLGVGGVLVYSGFSKAVGPLAEFAAVIDAYRIVPGSWATPLAQIIPWVELYAGTFLVFGYHTRWAAGAATGLFAMFIVVLSAALLRHIDLASCGCFGPGLNLPPRITIGLDGFLFACALLVFFFPPHPLSVDDAAFPRTSQKGSFSV